MLDSENNHIVLIQTLTEIIKTIGLISEWLDHVFPGFQLFMEKPTKSYIEMVIPDKCYWVRILKDQEGRLQDMKKQLEKENANV